jgi:hypothetical protein
MNDANYKLTTVKVLTENYNKFKIDSLESGMTLQKLVNRSIEKYLNDPKFKKLIENSEVLHNNSKF